MAKAGYGFLRQDWLANTVDPVPAFTFIVFCTRRFLHDFLFYIYTFLLFGVYIYSICGIAAITLKIDATREKFLSFLALVLAFHSPLVDYIASNWLGISQPLLLNPGVAAQYLLGYVFQPSLFGVFFVLSIYLFLKRKLAGSIIALAIAATFHTSLMLSAAMLTLSYIIVIFKEEREYKKSLQVGFFALILVLPAVVYLFIHFTPDSTDTWRQSQEILTKFRIPHHILSKRELGELFYFRVLVIVVAIYLSRKTRLFGILILTFCFAVVLSIIQIFTDSNNLGLMFPWRFSTVLVPLSITIIVGYGVSLVFGKTKLREVKFRRHVTGGFGVFLITFLVFWGIREMVLRFEANRQDKDLPVMEFVKNNKSPDDRYLIPSLHLEELEKFRLYTGAPILIDFKAMPFKAHDVKEWYQRITKARQFYESAKMDCQFLNQLAGEYGLTHVVLENRRFPNSCEELEMLYRDDVYGVYRINRSLVTTTY
jgi:hypothetical protein